ncbi:inositol monophosphatase [Alphaproteobacteria bacterium]|nr:inositol monophosphatase [Alphaproteobacteria bacterium]
MVETSVHNTMTESGFVSITRKQLELISEIVKSAAETEIMPRFRNLSDDQIETKSDPTDFVTEADKAAEIAISAGLRALFPDAFVFGEEAVAADPSLLAKLSDADLSIIIDPIDGTGNFVAERPRFGTIIAVVIKGEVAAGFIYNPNSLTSHCTIWGEGAWQETADGITADLAVKTTAPLGQLTGSGGLKFLPKELREQVRESLKLIGSYEHAGSCAVRYPELANGELDFMFFNRLMPWDHAAGWLLHKEAGGYSHRLDGLPYRPTDFEGPLLLTNNEETWETLKERVFSVFSSGD